MSRIASWFSRLGAALADHPAIGAVAVGLVVAGLCALGFYSIVLWGVGSQKRKLRPPGGNAGPADPD